MFLSFEAHLPVVLRVAGSSSEQPEAPCVAFTLRVHVIYVYIKFQNNLSSSKQYL